MGDKVDFSGWASHIQDYENVNLDGRQNSECDKNNEENYMDDRGEKSEMHEQPQIPINPLPDDSMPTEPQESSKGCFTIGMSLMKSLIFYIFV